MKTIPINIKLFTQEVEKEATRAGFGKGLVKAAHHNKHIVALTADLAGSTKLTAFQQQYPDRFIQAGVAEQNLATVASGLAHVGKIPFITSFAIFSPGRNWEQIRTTIGYNNQNVKIIGSHGGLGVGGDGATHQALEDLAITRVVPNLCVLVPCDALQAEKATLAMAKTATPTYMRVHRQKTPVLTTPQTPFVIGKAQLLRAGHDVALVGCGPQLYDLLEAAQRLAKKAIRAAVVNVHTLKPLDEQPLVNLFKKTGCVVTLEDHQTRGGLAGALSELAATTVPVPMEHLGVHDRYGESGTPEQLYHKHGMTSKDVVAAAQRVLKRT